MGIVNALHRSFENPATSLSDPAEWLREMFAGGVSDSGVEVNRQTALGLPPLLRAVTLIATDTAKLPLFIYKRLPEGGKERDTKHTAFYLLRRKPVPEMTAFTFKQTLVGHALLRGNGYAYVWRRGDGAVRELWLLSPDATFPVRVNGKLWYVTEVDGERKKLRPADVLHLKGLGFDGLSGYPLVEVAKDSIGLGLGVQKYRGKFFANNARPSIILEHPGNISDTAAENVAKSWDAIHGGLDKSHRTGVLEEGMKAHAFSINAKDAQLVESLPYTARDASCLTGVPSHKLGDPERSSYASLEQENQSYLNDCLDGWLTAFEDECWDKLLSEREKQTDSHVVEFLRAALVRADLSTRYGAYHQAIQDGWMNRDEVRERENMNPLPDGKGAEFFEPLNMGTTGGDDSEDVEPEPELEEEGERTVSPAQRALLVDALTRMVKRIATPAERKAKQGGKAFFDWLDNRLDHDHHAVVLDAIANPVQVIQEAMPAWSASLDRAQATFMGTVRDRLLSASECTEAELSERVIQAMATLEKDCSGVVLNEILIGVDDAR